MVVFSALRDAVGVFRRRPVLLPVVAALLLVPQLLSLARVVPATSDLGPLLQVVQFVAGPFFVVPALGLLDDATADTEPGGETRLDLDAATDGFAANVVSLVGANAILLLGAVAWAIATVVVSALLSVLGLALGFLVLVAAIPLVQFVDVAVVVGDSRAVDAVKESVGLATDHFGAAVGFLAVRLGISALAAAPFFLVSNALPPRIVADGPLHLTPLAVATGVFALAVTAVLVGYRVCVYRALTAADGTVETAGYTPRAGD